jgi:hypothetical protein
VKNISESTFQVKKSLDLLSLQVLNDNGTPKYVPVRVRTRDNNDENKKDNDGIGGGGGVDGKNDYTHVIEYESGSGSGREKDKERDTDKIQSHTQINKTKIDEWGGDVWIADSRVIPCVVPHTHNTTNNTPHTMNIRVCVCLRVKEVEKEVAHMEYSASVKKILPGKKLSAPSSLSTKDENKDKDKEKEKEKDRERERERERESSGSKYQCQFFFIDCEIVENSKKPKGTFLFRTDITT